MIPHRLRRIESLLDLLGGLTRGRRTLPPRRLQTAQDVIDLLQEQVEAVRHESLADPLEKARAVGYLAVRRAKRSRPALWQNACRPWNTFSTGEPEAVNDWSAQHRRQSAWQPEGHAR
jgi:hypothetical protein